MRQSSARCFGQMFNGISGPTNQISITKFVGLASAATQSSSDLSLSNSNSPLAKRNLPIQRWISTLNTRKPTNSANGVVARAMSSNHPQIWTAEKVVSLIMVPGIIVPFMWTTPLTDAIFCTLGQVAYIQLISGMNCALIRPHIFVG